MKKTSSLKTNTFTNFVNWTIQKLFLLIAHYFVGVCALLLIFSQSLRNASALEFNLNSIQKVDNQFSADSTINSQWLCKTARQEWPFKLFLTKQKNGSYSAQHRPANFEQNNFTRQMELINNSTIGWQLKTKSAKGEITVFVHPDSLQKKPLSKNDFRIPSKSYLIVENKNQHRMLYDIRCERNHDLFPNQNVAQIH